MNTKIFKTPFASVYPHYVKKIQSKGRTIEELNEIIFWLTNYNKQKIDQIITDQLDFETFFAEANLNPNVDKIKGVICGYRVEEIQDPLYQKIRFLDKLIDELAKGKSLEKILRK